MYRKISYTAEKGQALTELVCVLPLLLCVMLIVLFIAGAGLSNIRAVKEARSAAEHKAVNTAEGSAGSMIYSWNYGRTAPFSAQDRIRSTSSVIPSVMTEDALANEGYSSNAREVPYFEFRRMGALQTGTTIEDGVFGRPPAMFLEAANLVSGRADDSSGKNNFFYSRWNQRTINSYELTFGRFFSMRINDLDIAKQRANTVYFPALQTDRGGF